MNEECVYDCYRTLFGSLDNCQKMESPSSFRGEGGYKEFRSVAESEVDTLTNKLITSSSSHKAITKVANGLPDGKADDGTQGMKKKMSGCLKYSLHC